MDSKTSSENVQSKKSKVKQTLSVEGLSYNLPQNPTVIKSKNQQVFFPHKSEYSDSDNAIVLTLNSGSDFVDGKNSYLAFELKVNTSAGLTAGEFINFGQGSAANIFREIVIRSRDGSEIERIRQLNSLTCSKHRWSKSEDWFKTVGSSMGYVPNPEYVGVADDEKKLEPDDQYNKQEITDNLTGGYVFTIPLCEISGLFNVDKLLPSQLMSGLRIELILEQKEVAFRNEIGGLAKTVTSYTVSAPEFRMETVKLSDSIMNQVSQNSANGGLYLCFDTYDLTRDTVTESANIEVRKNVSQATGVTVKSRITAEIEGDSSRGVDSMRSEQDHKVSQYRFRLGSMFIPSSVVTRQTEHYTLSTTAWGKLKSVGSENQVSIKSYLSDGKGLISSDFERSNMMLSGVSISNSRILAWEGKYSDSVGRSVDVHLGFKRVLRVFLTNVVVED